EQPSVGSFEGIRASISRAALLILVGVALSVLAGLVLARRMVKPIQALQAGAARIGTGELGHRIEVKTGDELETLADQFNRTAAQLEESYANLEQKVEARTRELSQALEQQTATAEILRVISQSPTDVQPVFDIISERAVSLCRAEVSAVSRFDGTLLQLVALHNITPEGVEAVRASFPMRPDAQTTSARVLRDRALVQIQDVLADPTYAAKDTAQAGGWRCGLGVPMFREGQVIGVVFVGRSAPRLFTNSQVELLKTFADQAVIAIENVRLFRELQDRTRALARSVEELQVLGEVGRAVGSTLDLETVLTTIIRRANQLSGTDFGVIYEYDEGTERFRLRATENLDEDLVELLRSTPLGRGEGAMGLAAETREPVQISDIFEEGAYQSR